MLVYFAGFVLRANGQYLIVWAKSPPPLLQRGQLYSRKTGQMTLPSSDRSIWLWYTSAGSPFDWQKRQNPSCEVATGITLGLNSSWSHDGKNVSQFTKKTSIYVNAFIPDLAHLESSFLVTTRTNDSEFRRGTTSGYIYVTVWRVSTAMSALLIIRPEVCFHVSSPGFLGCWLLLLVVWCGGRHGSYNSVK